MKGLTRKEREREARKESIIDAAEIVISEKGFENATMDEIAEKAELGKGTLYLHFKSKAAIYLAICERGSRILNQSMAKVLSLDVPGLEMVQRLGQEYLDFIHSKPIYYISFKYYENAMSEDKFGDSTVVDMCEENAREGLAYIVRALQIGMQDGSIKNNINPKELGLIIWGASKGVIHMAYLKQNCRHLSILDEVQFSLESLMHNFIEIIGTGIKNDSQSKNI